MPDQSHGVMLWQVDIFPAKNQTDRRAEEIAGDAKDLKLVNTLGISTIRGFLLQGDLDETTVDDIAKRLLVEPVVEQYRIAPVGNQDLSASPNGKPVLLHVLPKPGVTDPQAETALREMQSIGVPVEAVRTYRKYWIEQLGQDHIEQLARRLLSNDSIEQVVFGPLLVDRLNVENEYQFELQHVEVLGADNDQLQEISSSGGLSLTLIEMRTIQQHFESLKRNPTDVELETIAQTWSEHCSHKTLAGKVVYRDEHGQREFDNLLKETIFAATVEIREELGDQDWCVSVFRDNAGIVHFDDTSNITFKVETHNRPSALEPYGGANTGIGGVIRDTLGTGMGAKPICNTDVFCFARPDMAPEDLPPGVLHPRRIMKGVVAGVRDYGNRMGIPTVNGAIYFDARYVGNPLVFCGNVGLVPSDMSFKEPQDGDLIVVIGGPTGRDGIHGATFSSAELTETSEKTSGGAVQIGNAITEKMVMDVLLQARDRGLYNAITDCGAGGFSSAVGEMGEELGAVVNLEQAPLKYQGLSYTEVWISEAQERMVLSVPEQHWPEFEKLCSSESVDATVIGRFESTGKLRLLYHDNEVASLDMEFLHGGRPAVMRDAVYLPPATEPIRFDTEQAVDYSESLLRILGSPNVASKHWVIRQYDHEVLAGSVVKPLVGAHNDGPSDAAVVRPKLESRRGIAISCGMNPYFGDLDPYHMATSSIDEAVRNCIAVGADPARIAILDNFCWGYTDRPETLGSLVRAAIGCHDLATTLQTPFISGKDSLNNEFSYKDESGLRKTISIPSTLLISAMGQVDDVGRCVTMDLKKPGNLIYLVGMTKDELGGSHFNLVNGFSGGHVPKVDGEFAKRVFVSLHRAITGGHVRACHDLSEGGLAAAISEMAFAGAYGASLDLSKMPVEDSDHGTPIEISRLFSESNTRFLCEVEQSHQAEFESCLSGDAVFVGEVTDGDRLVIQQAGQSVIDLPLDQLKAAWRDPLDWK